MSIPSCRRVAAPAVCLLLPGLLVVAALAGCGSSNPYSTVKVSGQVTYEDGSLIQAEEISLLFVSQIKAVDAKTKPRDGTARVNVADGTFSCASTYDYGDGLIPGEHRVAIQPMKDGVPVAGAVPAAYIDPGTTPLKTVVEPGSKPLVLKVPRS